MKTLRLATFGIRGFIGESLDPKVVIDFASSFANFTEGGRVLLGRDTRYSSPMLHAAVVSGLLSSGCEVLDLGICPTPMVQFLVKQHEARGAISISGGHNGMGWNSLSLLDREGAFVEPMGGELILDSFHAGDFRECDWEHLGTVEPLEDFADDYFKALSGAVNADAIRAKNFTVLIDPVGGAGCSYLEAFADAFNLNLLPINASPSGYLAREPEPRPRAGLQMASIIRHLEGDVGFILSSDMGRLSYVSESGEPLSEECTFPLILKQVLGKTQGPVITNICTTKAIDELAAAHDVSVIKTAVGQAHVVSALVNEQGVIAGEGNGSVAVPGFSLGFDGFLMMALTLEAMAESGNPVSQLVDELPRYHIVKRSVLCESRDVYRVLQGVRERMIFDILGMDLTDGLRLDWDDGWVHVRASKTQQIMRVISESDDKETAIERAENVTRMVNSLV